MLVKRFAFVLGGVDPADTFGQEHLSGADAVDLRVLRSRREIASLGEGARRVDQAATGADIQRVCPAQVLLAGDMPENGITNCAMR
jgi:hypothetical protein